MGNNKGSKSKPAGYKYGKRQDDQEPPKPIFEYDGFAGEKAVSNKGAEPFRSAKNRFFQQNYQPVKMSDKGYTVAYQLRVAETDMPKIEKLLADPNLTLTYESEVITLLEDSFVCSNNWDRFMQDMKSISKRLKGVILQIVCIGEDFPFDFWVAYAKDGMYYQDQIDIPTPEFDHDRLRE